jgi:hypothetical protein
MIQINLQFETGAEARRALEELLGGSLTVTQPEISIKDEKITESFEAPKTEVPAEETPVKKRRAKAEIEHEKAVVAVAETVEEEKDIQAETPAKEETKAVTKEMLQEKAVNLIRNGKKEQVTATIKGFGADSISQADKNPVKPGDYSALMDAFNAIV